jgi:glycosyltransferase involved in cell wall biosynthesis
MKPASARPTVGKLRILHLTTYLQGGAGRAITDLACAQHDLGHRVTVVASEHAVAGYGNYAEYLERLRASGVELVLADSLFTRDLRLNLEVVDRLRSMTPFSGSLDVDVIHAHAAVPALIGRLLAGHSSRRIPIVQTQHGWGITKTAEQAAMDLAILRDVDRVVTTSRATRDLLVSLGTPRGTLTVIPCGIPADPPINPVEEARRVLDPFWSRAARLIACVGSVNENKNQRLIVEALPALADLDVAAVFIGEGGEALAERARELGVEDRVVACGYQPRAAEWLPLCDVVVAPSRTEGQGLIVLEAFRAGVPVVASSIPAFTELVDDGRTGLLFESGSVEGLVQAIRRAVSLPAADRSALVGRAKDVFLEGFTHDGMVSRHEQLYRGLLTLGAVRAA